MSVNLLLVQMPLFLAQQSAASANSAPLCSEPNSPCIISCTEPHSCYATNINVPLSTYVLFNCSGDYSCEHLNVIASDIDGDHALDEPSNFTIVCAGENSCNDAVFDISGEYALSLDCRHPNSCFDTSLTVQTSHNKSTEGSLDSDVQIDFSDSCSEFLSIYCVDEASQCSLYCENKYILIAANAFRVTTIGDADTCVEQQFIHSCPYDDKELEHTRARCQTIPGVYTTMMTQTVWNVRQRADTNSNPSDYCTHTPYHGEFEKRITATHASYDMAQNEGQGLRAMSVIVAVGCLCVMLSIFWSITVDLCRCANRIYHNKFITRKPPMYYLWGPFVCDALIFIAFYWWLIKGVVFESSANAYCSANYPVDDFSQFRTACDNDDICELDKDDGTYECTSAFAEYYIWRWVVLSVFSVFELCRVCGPTCAGDYSAPWEYYDPRTNKPTSGYGAQCLCWLLFFHNPCSNPEYYDKFVEQVFWKRQMWTGEQESCDRCQDAWCCWYCDMLFRYGVHIAFACIHYAQYSPLLPESDAALTWYDVWPVIALMALKYCLQHCYHCRFPYDPERENPHEIREILVDRLEHSSLAAVVESYLPLYHDSNKCPAELLTRQVQNENGTQRRRKKTKGAYEQVE